MSLNFGTSYYWKVDEVGTATYPGSVWSFTTQPYQSVDDFESYTDKADEEIFSTWIDGLTSGSNGSTVGYLTAGGGTFGETKIVHGGKQSMPLAYDNNGRPVLLRGRAHLRARPRTGPPTRPTDLVVYFRGHGPGLCRDGLRQHPDERHRHRHLEHGRPVPLSPTRPSTATARWWLASTSIVNSNAWAKGGVMIRQSIEPGSTHAFMPITPGGAGAGNGASFQHRLTTAGASTNNDNTDAVVAAPYWVKIERKGNAFSGYISPDGMTWTQLGTAQTITMTGPVLIGLALCSHDAAIATSAAFSNVSTTGNVTGAWQVAEIGGGPAGGQLGRGPLPVGQGQFRQDQGRAASGRRSHRVHVAGSSGRFR